MTGVTRHTKVEDILVSEHGHQEEEDVDNDQDDAHDWSQLELEHGEGAHHDDEHDHQADEERDAQ